MERMTASKLKQAYQSMNPDKYYFDRASMRFFGDTMKNYYVPAKTVFVDTYTRTGIECYELQRIRPVKHGLTDSAYFAVDTFERILPKK